MDNQTADFNRLPVLSGAENYQFWSQRLTSFLRMRGLWRYVSGEQDAPFAPEISSWDKTWLEISMPKESKERLNKLARNWKGADDKAHGIICSTLSPAIEKEVINLSSSNLVWENLRSKYAYASMPMLPVAGLRKALGTHHGDYNNIQEYSSMMSAALDEFDRGLNEGEKLPESARIHFLLCNLCESWDGFVSEYLETRYDQKLETFHSVTQVLIQAEPEAEREQEQEQPVENPDSSWGAAW